MDNKSHITESEFLLEFFGIIGGRDLGDPIQFYTDNPRDILGFVKKCAAEKKPAFISVQPRTSHGKVFGIEKIFFDFDYGKKSQKLTDKEIEKKSAELEMEVARFVSLLINKRKPRLQPMVIKTRKGYHVHIYFDKVYSIDNTKEVYKTLVDTFRKYYESYYSLRMEYLDPSVDEDPKRLCRIPLSIHEGNGQKCIFIKLKGGKFAFEEDKIRGLAYFKNYSLKEDDLEKAIKITRQRLISKEMARKAKKEKSKIDYETSGHFVGQIRPCFQKALAGGEMPHQMRLALLLEAWYSGIKDLEGLVNIFRPLHDFDGDKLDNSTSRYQCNWFLEHRKYENAQPYTCDTLQRLGWCIEKNCEIYRRRHNI